MHFCPRTRFVIACLLAFVFASSYARSQNVSEGTSAVSTPTAVSQASPQSGDEQQKEVPGNPLEIRIGPGDLLEIRVFGIQELSQDVRVNGSGDIGIPLGGTVHVAGMTQDEAAEAIATKLRSGEFVKNPQVTVFTKEYATQGVSVLGEVNKPGVYPVLGARRLFDVISLAGGITQRAGKVVTITHRSQPDSPVDIALPDKPSDSGPTNVPVEPGDTVVVSKAGVVYVVGDVAKPSGFVMENNEQMTVLQALAMAGGTNSTASLDSSRVIRKGPAGIQEIAMPLKRILSAKAEDTPLRPGDVLFVPRSTGKSAARRGAEAILQITTGIAVYRH